MDKQERDRIASRFFEIIPNPECPMCHGTQFSVLDSHPVNPVTDDYRKPSAVIRRSIPSVAIVCVKCGFISLHAMAVMGLMYGGAVHVKNESTDVPEVKDNEQ